MQLYYYPSKEALYRQVLVYEESGQRYLCFTRQCAIGRQSVIDLAQPDRLVFLDFITDQTENVFPMVPGGKGLTEMILAEEL